MKYLVQVIQKEIYHIPVEIDSENEKEIANKALEIFEEATDKEEVMKYHSDSETDTFIGDPIEE